MLSREYKALFAGIHPDASLVADTVEKMRQLMRDQHPSRKIILMWGAVAAAVILLVSSVLSAVLLLPGVPFLHSPVTSGGGTAGVSSGGTESNAEQLPQTDVVVPDWYRSESFTLLALTGSSKIEPEPVFAVGTGRKEPTALSAQNAIQSLTLGIPDGLVAGDAMSERYIKLQQTIYSGKYAAKQNIYYDLEQKKVICMDEADEAVAEQSGLITSDLVYTGSVASPTCGRSVLQFQNRKTGHCVFYFRNTDDSLQKLPVTDNDLIGIRITPDLRYAMIIIDSNAGMNVKIWLVDLASETANATDITRLGGKQYSPSEFDITFSDNGAYLIYLLRSGNSIPRGANSSWICYHLESGAWFQGSGEIVRMVVDDTAFLSVTTHGLVVYEAQTGKDITETTALSEWEKTQIFPADYYESSGRVSDLYAQSLSDPDKKAELVAEGATQFYLTDQYAYTFSLEKKTVSCYSLKDKSSFTVAIPDEFFEGLEQDNPENHQVNYGLQPSMDGSRLVLYYTITDGEKYTYTIDEQGETKLPYWFWQADSLTELEQRVRSLVQSDIGGAVSVPSYSSAHTSFPDSSMGEVRSGNTASAYASDDTGTISWSDQTVSARISSVGSGGPAAGRVMLYVGNGFTGLRFGFGSRIFMAVEDYRDRTFTLYSGDGFSTINEVSIYRNESYPATTSFRKTLRQGASQEETKELYSYLTPYDAPVDYADLYTNGKLDEKKMWTHRLELLLNNITNLKLTHYMPNDSGVYMEWYWNNERAKRQLIEMLRQLEYKQGSDYFNQFGWWDCKGYWIPLYSPLVQIYTSVYIGRQIGSNKPFVTVDLSGTSAVAFLTEEQYRQFDALLKPEADQVREEYLKAMQQQ